MVRAKGDRDNCYNLLDRLKVAGYILYNGSGDSIFETATIPIII